jgi:hypothetical protein
MLSFFVKFMTAGLPEGRLHKWDVTKTWGPRGKLTGSTAQSVWIGRAWLPVRLLPTRPRVLSAGGILSARAEVLEPLLPILLRLLSSWSTPAQAPDGDQVSRLPIASVLRAVPTRQGDRSRYFGSFDQKHATMRC